MNKKFLFFCAVSAAVLIFPRGARSDSNQETLTFTTYYPSPYGVYKALVISERGAVGDLNQDNMVNVDDLPIDPHNDPLTGSFAVSHFLGIGTRTPTTNLYIKEGRPENRNRPAMTMEDLGSGTKFTMALRTGSGGTDNFMDFFFPADAGQPGSGRYMRVDEHRNVVFYGNALTVPHNEEDPDLSWNGMIYYNTRSNTFRVYANGVWKDIGGGPALHMAKMVRAAGQNVGEAGKPKIWLDTEIFDHGGIADPANGRFVIRQDGLYLVTTSWRCPRFAHAHEQSRDSEIMVYIMKNGGEALHAGAFVKGPVDETGYVLGQDVLFLRENDVIQMHVKHTAGRTISTLTGTGDRPRMSIVQIK
ncbi:MAG: hypothetical protein GF333_00180 [Candidatus Omnitrophica bacterium]|nr:hypothetical protein [Candidatus Omnitrophota bacterium]